jgi:predicted enzyme related to lactoylglutathione lyase
VGRHGVVWWELESADPTGSQEFYGRLFGWAFRRAFDEPSSELGRDYWIVEDRGRGIGGLQAAMPGAPGPQAGIRLYVEVDELEETLKRAVELGATVERDRVFLGSDDFWFANVRDPQGVSLGLWTVHARVDR